MQKAVVDLWALGPLPSERSVGADRRFADPAVVKQYETSILSIQKPVTDEEAKALVGLFGTDDCFGLAWTLVHLIETAPGWPIAECLQSTDNEWVRTLKLRSDNAMRMRNQP
jgi:hypothetical protein